MKVFAWIVFFAVMAFYAWFFWCIGKGFASDACGGNCWPGNKP